jgi:hypothetical protein
MFISNRQSQRKQNFLSSISIKSAPKSTFNPSTNSSNHHNEPADLSLEIERAHLHTLMLGISLKQAAHDYFYATKPKDIASINIDKARQASGQHLKQWADKPVITQLLRAEMAAINREFGRILDDSAKA